MFASYKKAYSFMHSSKLKFPSAPQISNLSQFFYLLKDNNMNLQSTPHVSNSRPAGQMWPPLVILCGPQELLYDSDCIIDLNI